MSSFSRILTRNRLWAKSFLVVSLAGLALIMIIVSAVPTRSESLTSDPQFVDSLYVPIAPQAPLIIGGEEVDPPGSYPWQVALIKSDSTQNQFLPKDSVVVHLLASSGF